MRGGEPTWLPVMPRLISSNCDHRMSTNRVFGGEGWRKGVRGTVLSAQRASRNV